MRVLDGAIAIFSAVEGVQPQSESVWRQAERYRVPRICFINKIDRIGANYRDVLQQLEAQLGARPVLMQLPIGNEGTFAGVIDLVTETALYFVDEALGRETRTGPVPLELAEEASRERERLVEAAADFDDEVLALFLAGEKIAENKLHQAIRSGTLSCDLFPVYVGTALRNRGIQPVLDAVGRYLPSPLDVPSILATGPGSDQQTEIRCDPKAPLCALAFKAIADEGRKLTYIRVYQGTIRAGDTVLNSTRNCPEKVSRLFQMHAHKRERIEEAGAGDIVAALGLKEALTGDTLCSPDLPVLLEGIRTPEPVVSLAVEPVSSDDRENLPSALEKLRWEDPTFRVREDEETGQTILTGMGELHLEIVTDRLAREFGVQVKTGSPRVVYRETIRKAVERREVFHREAEGKVHRGEVLLRLSPLSRGGGCRIVLPGPGEHPLPPDLAAALEDSLRQAASAGCVAGYPIVDIDIAVLEAPFTPGLVTEPGLRAAAQRGVMLAAREAAPTLLEPVMALQVVTPGEFAGRVLGSIQQKGGRVERITTGDPMHTISAFAPLSCMFGYMTELRSATKGRGTFTMEFSHFDLAPPDVLRRFGLA